MSRPDDLAETRIHAMLERRAARPEPGDIRTAILETTRSVPQRRWWSPDLSPWGGSLGRLLAVAILAGSVLAMIGVAAGGHRTEADPPASLAPIAALTTAAPTRITPADTGGLTYTSTIPDGSRLGAWAEGLVSGFTDGADHPYADKAAPGGRPVVAGRRGVMIATLRYGSFHRCLVAGRTTAQTTPTGILADIRVILKNAVHPRASQPPTMDEPVPTTFDGRPAWSTAMAAGQTDCTHIHVGEMTGPWVPLGFPSRVVAVDVDGVTALIVIWAKTRADLADFLPTAQELLDSIHFRGPGTD